MIGIKTEKFIILSAFAASLLFLYSVHGILVPFFIAAFIAYLLKPVADWLEQKMPRAVAVTLIFLFVIILGFTVLIFVVPVIFKQLGIFIQELPETLNWLYSLANKLSINYLNQELPSFNSSPVQQLVIDNWRRAGVLATQLVGKFGESTINAASFLVNFFLVPVIAFYLLRDWTRLTEKVASVIPLDYRRVTFSLLNECDSALSAFIRGQLMVMLALGCIYSVGLSIIGLKLALLLGMLAGLASIVPYLGVAVGIVSSVIAAYFQFHSVLPVIAVLGVFIVGQILESIVLTPVFVGDKIGLHPVVVIFAIMAGGELAGFTGVLIALPVSAVLVVLAKNVFNRYKSSSLYLSKQETIISQSDT